MTVVSKFRVSWCTADGVSHTHRRPSRASVERIRPLWTVHVCATTPWSAWSDSLSFFVPIVGVPARTSFASFLTQDALMVGRSPSHVCLWNDTTWNRPSIRLLMLTLYWHPSTLHAAENLSFVLRVTLRLLVAHVLTEEHHSFLH